MPPVTVDNPISSPSTSDHHHHHHHRLVPYPPNQLTAHNLSLSSPVIVSEALGLPEAKGDENGEEELDDDDDSEEFQRLRLGSVDQDTKTYQQRLNDIISDKSPGTLSRSGTRLSTNRSDKSGNTATEDEEKAFVYTNGVDQRCAGNGPGGGGDEEEEEEFVYDGKDVGRIGDGYGFDDDEYGFGDQDYAKTLESILETGNDSGEQVKPLMTPSLQQPSILMTSADGSTPPTELDHTANRSSRIRSPAPTNLSATSLSPSQLNNTFNRSISFTPSQSLMGSNSSSSFLNGRSSRPSNTHFSRLRSLPRPLSLQPLSLPHRDFSPSSTLASDVTLPDPLNLAAPPSAVFLNSPAPSINQLSASGSPAQSAHNQSPSSIAADSDSPSPFNGIFRWASLRKITNKIYPTPKRSSTVAVPGSASAASTLLGSPTVVAASGVIVIGTAKGWVMVFDYASNLRCVLGSDAIVSESGAVSSLAISHDHTFVAVGHAMGQIYLYDLSRPDQPARSVPPTTLKLVLEGRSEGHLSGSKIIHLGFVGLRHTAIVSADESGLAFYHALGQVLGLASTDVIRILGKYPEGPAGRLISPNLRKNHLRQASDISIESISTGMKNRKQTRIYGCSTLPLGPSPHPTDHNGLVSILTSTKLIIVGLKPTPRTWWRCTRNLSDSNQSTGSGALSWYPSSSVKDTLEIQKTLHEYTPHPSDSHSEPNKRLSQGFAMDPILAFSWGKLIRFVTVMPDKDDSGEQPFENGDLVEEGILKSFNRKLSGKVPKLRFVEGKSWACDSNVLAIQWLTWRILCVMTATHLEVIDTQVWRRTGFEPIDIRGVVKLDIFKELTMSNHLITPNSKVSSFVHLQRDSAEWVVGSFKAYKGKIFLLTTQDLRLGMVVSWADQILELVEVGSLIEAIELMISYWYGRIDFETIGLPSQDVSRQKIVKPKLKKIMKASLDYIFSDQRVKDDAEFDYEGRGVDRTELFEAMVRSSTRACIAMGELDFIFEDLFEKYLENGIQMIYLEQLEPFVLSSEISLLPTDITQAMINMHESRNEFDLIQEIIRHVEPACLDINQCLRICSRQSLYEALVYVYTEALNDFVGPLVEFLNLIKKIQLRRRRFHQDDELGDSSLQTIASSTETDRESLADPEAESLALHAYKIFSYLTAILTGMSYPNKICYEYERGSKAKLHIYHFLLSGQSIHWPQPSGPLILMTEEGQQESTFPYLRALLMFDAEATLDTLDVVFEDSWLDENLSDLKVIDRQCILNLLLDVVGGDAQDFSSSDRMFCYIFVCRNLPKYPQFLTLPKTTLHSILINLSTEKGLDTVEDRQLALEHLLSIYNPVLSRGDANDDGKREILEMFEEAKFYRILRWIYDSVKNYVKVLICNLQDFDLQPEELFESVTEVLIKNLKGLEHLKDSVKEILLDSILRLLDLSVDKTAKMIEDFDPDLHGQIIEKLESFQSRQLNYLRALMRPNSEGKPVWRSPDPINQLKYFELLCEFDPSAVVHCLKSSDLSRDLDEQIINICRENQVYDGTIWQINQSGNNSAAFKELHSVIQSLSEKMNQNPNDQAALLNQISNLIDLGAEICISRSSQPPHEQLSPENCWLELFSTIITSIQSFSICNNNTAAESLRKVLLRVLSSLISRSTSSTSFSNLVKKLISRQQKGNRQDSSAIKEFRWIVTMIMDSYRFQGSVLEVTSKLVDQDLHENLAQLNKERQRGIRPAELICDICRLSIQVSSQSETKDESNDKKLERLGLFTSPFNTVSNIDSKILPPIPVIVRKKSLKGKEVEPCYHNEYPVTSGQHSSINDQYVDTSMLYYPHQLQSRQQDGDHYLNRSELINPLPMAPQSSVHAPFLLKAPPNRLIPFVNHSLASPMPATDQFMQVQSSSQLKIIKGNGDMNLDEGQLENGRKRKSKNDQNERERDLSERVRELDKFHLDIIKIINKLKNDSEIKKFKKISKNSLVLRADGSIAHLTCLESTIAS